MATEFGGGWIFNGPSPSSDGGVVNRIIADYVTPVKHRPRRILDVGGSKTGFRRNATLPEATELVIVNPEGLGAQYTDISEIPIGDPGFDFAMLFGVLMYGDHAATVGLLRAIRGRLRDPHPTLLVAEPDPVSVLGFPDAVAKFTVGSLVRMVAQRSLKARFHIYSKADAEAMLLEAGFGVVQQREDLNPKLFGPIPRVPVYYVLAATV